MSARKFVSALPAWRPARSGSACSLEYNGYDRLSIIDHDGAPTRSFYESPPATFLLYTGNYTKAMNFHVRRLQARLEAAQ